MHQSVNFLINPIAFMKSIASKPEIFMPSILATIIPFLSYGQVTALLDKLETKWIILIYGFLSLSSLFMFFITAFIIYLLLSIVLVEKKVTFRQVYSIYGYTQLPKFIFAVCLILLPSLNAITIGAASSFPESLLNFFSNPLMIWKYILLICGFKVLTRVKMNLLVPLAIVFAIIEVGINYVLTDLTQIL